MNTRIDLRAEQALACRTAPAIRARAHQATWPKAAFCLALALAGMSTARAADIADPSKGCPAESHSCAGGGSNTLGGAPGGGGGSGPFNPPDSVPPKHTSPPADDPFDCAAHPQNCLPSTGGGRPGNQGGGISTGGGTPKQSFQARAACMRMRPPLRAQCLQNLP